MAVFVQVVEEEGDEPIELPAEEDGTLCLSTLSAQFPGATGLNFRAENCSTRGVRCVDNGLFPPQDGWGSRTYICVLPKGSMSTKRPLPNGEATKRTNNSEDQGPNKKHKAG
ncbi:TAR DNA-binding protein 43 isoform X2 [Bemisia tabaci]|nr:PREDICTED: TAR DNA-binding protein 43-like isoform X2 [Bemisia tabaci]